VGETQGKGRRGEALAAEFLVRRGYRILAANYRHLRKEIDLIAWGEGFVVFVEVKLRRDDRFGGPAAAVDARKQRAIISCARGFLHERGIRGMPCRFDVIAIRDEAGGTPRVEHIPNAFSIPF
jgi:putative endonuclease